MEFGDREFLGCDSLKGDGETMMWECGLEIWNNKNCVSSIRKIFPEKNTIFSFRNEDISGKFIQRHLQQNQ